MSRDRYRRNAHRQGAETRSLELVALGTPAAPAQRPPAQTTDSLLLAPGATPRDAWIQWLSPVFSGNDSCYFTGTYSDDYGYANGLMLVRNVHKDFQRFLESFDFQGRFIVGVEHHQYRDVLHLHGVLEGPFNREQLAWIKAWWQVERGYARALPVLDGCTSYVTKYALKGDTESFEWRLS